VSEQPGDSPKSFLWMLPVDASRGSFLGIISLGRFTPGIWANHGPALGRAINPLPTHARDDGFPARGLARGIVGGEPLDCGTAGTGSRRGAEPWHLDAL